jgi:hypothetical protein
MVLQGLKPRIFDQLNKFAGHWVQELPAILCSLRTTPNRSTGFTPFFLTYGTEAVLPSNLDHGAPRVKAFDPNPSRGGSPGRGRLVGRGPGDGPGPLGKLPADPSRIPQEEDPGKNPRSRRLGVEESAVDQGQAQAHSTLGKTVHDRGGGPAKNLSTEGQQWQHPHQHLEH